MAKEKQTVSEAKKVDTTQLWARVGRLVTQREELLVSAEKIRKDATAILQQIASLEQK